MPADELCFRTATELASLIRRREVSCAETMEAHLAQIDRVNPRVNAIVTYHPDRAMAAARAADAALDRGEDVGPLHGLPTAHKDVVDTAGVRTTYGSPIFADHVPAQDAIIVERMRRAGAISVGKTNTPEFAAGSQTFNPVFGATLNPYDLTKTCGGSSGGAAVALACGMLPLADGGDLGGSLRNPANFCNVVGFRTTAGRVPAWPSPTPWTSLSVQGPMARTVEDAALMLSAIAGPDPRAPIALPEDGAAFNPQNRPLERDFRGVRVAWSADMGGLPVDSRVAAAMNAQRETFTALGCAVEDACPDFSGANEIFMTMRAATVATTMRGHYENRREMLKDTIVWNIEEGMRLTAVDVGGAEVKRAALFDRVRLFMQRYEFMVFPVSQRPPFDVNIPYPTEINGAPMETFIDWMRSCYYVTAAGNPAISVPCGFTDEGLPVGVQIVSRHQSEFAALQLAYAFQQATEFWRQRPAIAA